MREVTVLVGQDGAEGALRKSIQQSNAKDQYAGTRTPVAVVIRPSLVHCHVRPRRDSYLVDRISRHGLRNLAGELPEPRCLLFGQWPSWLCALCACDKRTYQLRNR